MPIFMDRHDVSKEVTAEIVAQLHQEDLKIQDNYKCKGLTYWFDDVRKTAFCLIEAPDKQCIVDMHNNAHGEVPHRIIEVNPSIVESFLGRIEDPAKSKNSDLNIINDPAFRILLTLRNNHFQDDFLEKTVSKFHGRIVTVNLISFTSVSSVVHFAIEINSFFEKSNSPFGIGIASGIPVTEKDEIFENTIKLSERLSNVALNNICISQEVFDLFMSENQNKFPFHKQITITKKNEEKFLTSWMDYLDANFQNADLQVNDFSGDLGFSRSKFYRVLKSISGKSPNIFLKDFRLNKALNLLKTTDLSVSEIAFQSGFNSPSYFSKCFHKKFTVNPTAFQTIN